MDGVCITPTALLLLLVSLIFDTTYATSNCSRRRLRLLSQICYPEDEGQQHDGAIVHASGNAIENIKHFVEIGHLSKARQIAYECLALIRSNELYDSETSLIGTCCPSTQEEVIQTYKYSIDAFFHENEDFLGIVVQSQHRGDIIDNRASSSFSPHRCWDGRDQTISLGMNSLSFGEIVTDNGIGSNNMSPGSAAIERWNDCCSFFRPCSKESTCFDKTHENTLLCCELSEGLDNHLILPALREPFVTVRLQFRDLNGGKEVSEELIEIEQEGSLRMFDVAGVLWPAGYLLGLCLSNPIACGFPEVLDAVNNKSPLAVELGAGVGFPSIAFAKATQQHKTETSSDADRCDQHHGVVTVSTDVSHASLTLIKSNALNNGVGDLVTAWEANHTDPSSLSLLSQQFTSSIGGNEMKDGFDVVFGSSLQALFDGTSRQSAVLWHSLDALLSKGNAEAVVLLSHVRAGNEKIELPPASERLFECVRRVSGDHFGMRTRDGHTSDFELVLLRRRR